MTKDTNTLLMLSLLGSVLLTLLVSAALVLIFVLRQKEKKAQDTESFKFRAVKESKEFGLLSPTTTPAPAEARRLQQTGKHTMQLEAAFVAAAAKEKKESAPVAAASTKAVAAAATAAAAAARQPASLKIASNRSLIDNQLSPEEKLKRHHEVTRWREEHDRTLGSNWEYLQRKPPPPKPVVTMPSLKSDETGSESSDPSDP